MAIMHGMQFKKSITTEEGNEIYSGDPVSCSGMSQEEKEKLTQELIAKDKEKFKKFGLAKKG